MQVSSSQIQSTINFLNNIPENTRTPDEVALLQGLQGLDLSKDSVVIPTHLQSQFNKSSTENTDSLPPPSSHVDFSGALKGMNNLENLMLLMSVVSRSMREAKFAEAKSLLEAKVQDLNSAADKKIEGANELKSSALTAMIIGIVASTISLISAGVGLGRLGSLKTEVKEAFEIGLKSIDLVNQLGQGASQAFSAGATYESSRGQAANQEKSAQSDKLQAKGTQKENLAKEQQELENIAKEFLKKMTDMLQALADTKQKAMEAAAKS